MPQCMHGTPDPKRGMHWAGSEPQAKNAPMADDALFAYHLQEVIGRGGFGAVYRAELRGPSGFAKVVAIKLLNRDSEANPDLVQRLRDEARMLALVQHRAIVQVDRLVQLEGRWAVVMEYVPGFDLHAIIDRGGRIPLGPALEIAEEIASALHVAYTSSGNVTRDSPRALRLIHRDVKPANIRITPSGAVKLLDFGIARAHFPGREAHTDSVRFGSMNYMSPLRLAMSDDGHAGDVYALGAVLCEMLSGKPVGMSSHHSSAHREIVGSSLQRLRELGLAPTVVGLVERALSYAPDQRPDARTFLSMARSLRASEAPGSSLMEWVDTTFPRLEKMAPPPQAEEGPGEVLSEASPTNPTLHALVADVEVDPTQGPLPLLEPESSQRYDPSGLLGIYTDDVSPPSRPQPTGRGGLAVAVLALLGIATAAAAWFADGSEDHHPTCEQVPMDQDRDAIRSVDALFRGWQQLDIDQLAAVLAPRFERRDGTNGRVLDRAAFVEERQAIFGRLESVTWHGPVHDGDGFGIPTVVDGIGVRCPGSDHLRVVVRYDWSVKSLRTGRETVEQDVVDAYEIGPKGLIISNLDYADLKAARTWRDTCCP